MEIITNGPNVSDNPGNIYMSVLLLLFYCQSPPGAESVPITVQLPSGTSCTGGSGGNKCLAVSSQLSWSRLFADMLTFVAIDLRSWLR